MCDVTASSPHSPRGIVRRTVEWDFETRNNGWFG